MRDFQMFTAEGNVAVGKIVDEARKLADVSELGFDPVWNWVVNELEALGTTKSFSEADDTAVREAVYEALLD